MILVYIAVGSTLGALALLFCWAMLELRSLPRVEEREFQSEQALPRLSVIVPARDEAMTIGPAVESLLMTTYPDLEVLLVNDRSTDDTGPIMERFAAADHRVRALQVEALPDGWLGKLNALNVGTAQATGDVLLFADADVYYGPECLSQAVSWLEEDALDHLALFPRVRSRSLLAEAVIGYFGLIFLLYFRPSRVNRGVEGAFVGIGAFNMVRREAFERTEGWEWLRLEVADDVGLGLMMARNGGRSRLGLAIRSCTVEWYDSVRSMVGGLEKNLYLLSTRAQPLRAVVYVVGLLLPTASLVLSLALVWAPGLTLAGIASLASCVTARAVGAPLSAGAAAPFCGPFMAWAMARSAWRGWRTGTVSWRDTSYSMEELLEGQRVQM